MILQLNPFLPVYVPKFNQKGFAFLVTQFSQEHPILFCIALDDGTIWELNNKEIRFQNNISMERIINQ